MAVPTNTLQSVQTYQMAGLAFLQNSFAAIHNANKKFKDFENLVGNLGTTVGFELPPRFTTTNSLTASFQGIDQRVQTLTVNNPISVAVAVTNQQYLFNVQDYMERVGKGAIVELGSKIETNVLLNCETGPYRFYGNGSTPISSYNQLAQALALWRTFGAPTHEAKAFFLDVAEPAVIGSGLNQFAMKRNDRDAFSWEMGAFSECEWFRSNLLPTHYSGTEGNEKSTLTVVSVTKNSDGGVTSITFSGTHAASDVDSVKAYDRFQFQDGVSGFTNLRFRTFVGHEVSASPVQFMATADAASTAGSQVTVSITPALQAAAGKNQNINTEIVAGMQCKVMPSHRVGMIYGGDALFLGMPRLPDQDPFYTANVADPDSGASIRLTYGAQFGQNSLGYIWDAIWGSTFVPEYGMALLFPL